MQRYKLYSEIFMEGVKKIVPCVIFTQIICLRQFYAVYLQHQIKNLILCTHTNIHILLLLQIV